jgi:LPXTG-site transpeptidase (sortase) family protein
LSKTISTTNQSFTSGSDVAIGEIVTYQVSIIIPSGTFANAKLVDTMQRGLAFVKCDSITGGALTTSIGALANVCNSPTVDDAGGGTAVDVGRRVAFDFGTLSNPSVDDQSLTVTYEAVVLDSQDNHGIPQTSLQNSASWTSDPGSLGPVSATVKVVEPKLAIKKTASNLFVANGTTTTFTLTVTHTAQSQTNAYEVVAQDVLPTGLDLVSGTLTCTLADQTNCSYNSGTHTITAAWSEFDLLPAGGTKVVTFTVQGNANLPSSGSVTNVGTAQWTSLPGVVPAQTSNQYSTERYYDPGASSAINNYTATSSLVLNSLGGGAGGFVIPITGFAPGESDQLYRAPFGGYPVSGDLNITIPSQKLSIPIVGAVLENGGWNIDWLWYEAAWLQGTAYPTYSGNSVITAHVVTADGKPGPFARLKQLQIGDRVYIVSNGYRYIYVVRATKSVGPTDISILEHKDVPWLTLVTCDQYDKKTRQYLKRIVVSAELIQIEQVNK